jgi:hypothetical protein
MCYCCRRFVAKNFLYYIMTDPLPNLIIPLWAIVAYLIIALEKQKEIK